MNGPKFRSGVDFARTLAATQPAATTPASTATPARSSATHNAHLKEAFFQQSGMSIQMRRGPIQRMPLRPAKTSRSGAARGPGRTNQLSDEPDFELPDSEVPSEEAQVRRPSSFRYDKENNDGKQDGSDRDERRLQKVFSLSTSKAQASASAATGSIGARAHGLKKPEAIVLPPLLEIKSLHDVLHLIQSTSQADPSGKSVPLLLRRINAAVLQNKISLPKIDRIADVREMLIEIFGKGHQSPTALSPNQRSLHAMLPLWLLNLGRQRTLAQQTHAAARLSLPLVRSSPMD